VVNCAVFSRWAHPFGEKATMGHKEDQAKLGALRARIQDAQSRARLARNPDAKRNWEDLGQALAVELQALEEQIAASALAEPPKSNGGRDPSSN
jgi:hypothetical protein